MKNHSHDSTNSIKLLEEHAEDRTNRQLRKTLLFHNIPEELQESWAQTEKRVAEAIGDVCNILVAEAAENLEGSTSIRT